jgi:tripartite-type tricarboxylate transporter receptor subunit TctC
MAAANSASGSNPQDCIARLRGNALSAPPKESILSAKKNKVLPERRVNRRDLLLLASSAFAASAARPRSAIAQAKYPDRPIRLIVPFAPGGVGDIVGRMWADKMTTLLGTVVIENRSGASGMIGAAEVARAEPDGTTLLLGNTSTQVLNPLIVPNPTYDAVKDFATIGIVANSPFTIAVNPSVPARTYGELVAYIKANPGKMSYGSAGTGTITQLAGELFKQVAGTPDVTHIPYKGGGPSVSDLVSGHIPIVAVSITNSVLELHRTGKIRIVMVMSPQRVTVLPEVQSAADTDPRLVASIYMGLFAPAATPKPIIERIAKATRAASESEDYKGKLLAAGYDPVVDTPEEAQRFLDAERHRFAPLVRSLNFKLQ